MEVTVYSTHTCPWCKRAKDYLTQRGIQYKEKFVDDDYAAATEMVGMTKQQGVPVIQVDGQFVVGFDKPRLEKLLADSAQQKITLGAAVADASKILVKRGQIPIFGAYVGKVAPGSPAERIGILPGDVITRINLRPIANGGDVEKALEAVERGMPLSAEFIRGERQLRGTVTV